MCSSIRIAIVGGGLAGASLLHALLKYPHLDIHIFESAAEFKEAGAAVGVARNGLAALDLIGSSATECLERAGAVPQRGVRFMLAQGKGKNSMIDEARDGDGHRLTSIVHRAAFLRELLIDVPPERLHPAKKLDRVERSDDGGPVTLYFIDGTAHECDILIGADGIHSMVRKIILDEEDPAAYPRNAGWWAVMALKPYATARSSLGEGLVDADNAREHMWVGDGTYLMHNVLNQGQLVQLVICAYDKDGEASDQWHRMVDAEEIMKLYQGWPPYLNKAVNELLCDQAQQPAMYLWDHPPARTYTSGPICIMGDAAHATTPWQGSGCGMSIEDSLILSTLLGRSKTPAEATVALRVYDQVRRPRTQRIVESSKCTGIIMTGKGEETGLALEKLKQNILPRWDFILDFNNAKARDEAAELMTVELAKI
ncbi:hypothetical protein QQS21_003574 [Conoideocrella luteorostrata]|uniref:FAD-binding domain-containing protein n=1 Tax=Conoideocrella luteorostrata TaxID=1105319 RepID=A0AAJ0CT33_9HYPO|nr:hypothetical protein QQS21_003574 [Conoideocrella luteorostrata]